MADGNARHSRGLARSADSAGRNDRRTPYVTAATDLVQPHPGTDAHAVPGPNADRLPRATANPSRVRHPHRPRRHRVNDAPPRSSHRRGGAGPSLDVTVRCVVSAEPGRLGTPRVRHRRCNRRGRREAPTASRRPPAGRCSNRGSSPILRPARVRPAADAVRGGRFRALRLVTIGSRGPDERPKEGGRHDGTSSRATRRTGGRRAMRRNDRRDSRSSDGRASSASAARPCPGATYACRRRRPASVPEGRNDGYRCGGDTAPRIHNGAVLCSSSPSPPRPEARQARRRDRQRSTGRGRQSRCFGAADTDRDVVSWRSCGRPRPLMEHQARIVVGDGTGRIEVLLQKDVPRRESAPGSVFLAGWASRR